MSIVANVKLNWCFDGAQILWKSIKFHDGKCFECLSTDSIHFQIIRSNNVLKSQMTQYKDTKIAGTH